MVKVAMSDVLDDLKLVLYQPDRRAGTADSDINIFNMPILVPAGVIERAIKEIERSRSLLGDINKRQLDMSVL